MSDLARRLPHVTAFAHALGCGIIMRTAAPVDDGLRDRIGAFIEAYERSLSRFRDDSTVAAMARAPHGGAFAFPDWAAGLFDLYDRLFAATAGAIDPCVGGELDRLGYGVELGRAFRGDCDSVSPAAGKASAPLSWDELAREAVHRPVWGRDMVRNADDRATLVTDCPVRLDFGACGKGYLVDLIAGMVGGDLIIDAGGDLFVRLAEPIAIGLEDPRDPSQAVGVAHVANGAFCASAPSRRRWRIGGLEAHHLINALDGRPANDVAAAWTFVAEGDHADGHPADHPAATADGLATALFVASPSALRAAFAYDCAVLGADRTARVSPGFPGAFFTA